MDGELIDLACVMHVHSLHSDGTGTVTEIARAAAASGVDVVLLTDHDTLDARAAGEERRYGPVLVCVGEEVSPRGRNHYLAFGLDEPLAHAGLGPQQIVDAVSRAGGFGFLSHPFSRGARLLGRTLGAMPWEDLDVEGYTGLELWSFVTDTAEQVRSLRGAANFIARPGHAVDHPPAGNLAAWDRLTATRRVVAVGGLDAHQLGWRIAGRVPLRVMAYRRSFAFLRTHVLVDRPPGADDRRDRDAVYAALREGRCYLAVDALAPARGFQLWADGAGRVVQGEQASADARMVLHARLPRSAALTIRRDGEIVASAHGAAIDLAVPEPGAYRLEAMLAAHGRMRTWILSNPVYLR
jgi:hypothetical protein